MKARTYAWVLSLVLSAAGSAAAQGGGASSTGAINGRVTDNSGAVLPGVTVTIASASLMGTQNGVTNEPGFYRFPAVPPGTYSGCACSAFSTTVTSPGVRITPRTAPHNTNVDQLLTIGAIAVAACCRRVPHSCPSPPTGVGAAPLTWAHRGAARSTPAAPTRAQEHRRG